MIEELQKVFEILDLSYDEHKDRQYQGYMEGILDWNEHVNLTAIKDRDEFIEKHYIDSLLCAGSSEFRRAKTIIDVGTGGGFPGIPLAIAFPEKQFTLMDSLNKRIRIIQQLCDELGIENVNAVHGRAEELGRKKHLRESFDLCVSRAVANMSTLSEYCLPFVKVGGCFIAYKGPDCEEELIAAEKAEMKYAGRRGDLPLCCFYGRFGMRSMCRNMTGIFRAGVLYCSNTGFIRPPQKRRTHHDIEESGAFVAADRHRSGRHSGRF